MATTESDLGQGVVAGGHPSRIRNVALVGHGGSGKTTLAEALLLRAGAIARAGRVDDGTTVCDVEPEAVKRHQSLGLALAPFDWQGHRVNLIDTPGYADFEAEVEAALAVADLAVVVVSAVDGVQARTEWAWRRCSELGLPRLVFVNQLDRDRASFDRVFEQVQERFGQGVAPLELPIGEESAFCGVADLLTDTAITYDGRGAATRGPLPDELADREHAVHDALVEGIVVADDGLLERFFAGDTIDPTELEHTLAHGVASAQVFPVVCGSAVTGVGVDRLADFLVEIGPSPVDGPPTVVHGPSGQVEVLADPQGPPLAFVFKTIADPYVGQLSVFVCLSGTIRADDRLLNVRTGTEERLHGLFRLRGKDQQPVTHVVAGDIAAVAKLAGVRTGDTLAPKGTPVRVAPTPVPPAVFSVAVRARTQADDDKLSTALARLCDEDPALVVHRSDATRQTVLSGVGETHVQVAVERLARKFGVQVVVDDLLIAYRETVTGTAEAEGKLKKQSGGHGQFAVVQLRVSPLERGAGFRFVDSVVGGAVPRSYIPAVEKGVLETMAAGGVHGFPVVDVQVELLDGKFHAVDSSEMAFKTAASIGFKDAMAKAGVVVLEPVHRIEVTVPAAHQGDVMGDVNGRRGRVLGSEAVEHGEQSITAQVPAVELLRYAVELRSLTGGRGRFTAAYDHDEPMPAHLVDKATAVWQNARSGAR